MAMAESSPPQQAVMATTDLVAYTRKELEADAERQATLQAGGGAELPKESQTGATLDLSHRNIRLLPVEVIALIKDRVERLALSHNPQITLPSDIVQCDRLRYLNIRWNQLKIFPLEVLGLKNLEILDLSKNKIADIPEDIKKMTSLKFLAVERNRITRLPLALGEMTKLQKMMFDDNPIEFPPLDALKPDPSVPQADKEREVCQQVKRFMRLEMIRDKLRTTSSDDLSENSQETPRASIRATGGRFPIRPSQTSFDKLTDITNTSPEDRPAPTYLQRPPAKQLANSTTSITLKRPVVTPLITSGDDINRTRSETTTSTSSIRSRRQGYVPLRKPTIEVDTSGDADVIRSEPDSASQRVNRLDPKHLRNPSKALVTNAGDTSSEATSPTERISRRPGSSRRADSGQKAVNGKTLDQKIYKVAQRLRSVFNALDAPVQNVVGPVTEGSLPLYQRPPLADVGTQLKSLIQHLQRKKTGAQEDGNDTLLNVKPTYVASVQLLKQYTILTKDLKASILRLSNGADAVDLRAFMFQIHYAMVELRNVCSLLGFKVKQPSGKDARSPQTWGSRTVTPTQPSRISTRRMRGATILQSMAGDTTLRAMPPPSLPTSRSNTFNAAAPLTARSGESFPAFPSRAPSMSRSNTLRSVTDESDNDVPFERIFVLLKEACELTKQNLPPLRIEIMARKERAQGEGQSIIARDLDRTLILYDAFMANENALLKRLQVVRLHEPGMRYQGDFWQLCDKFVQSWHDLLSQIRSLRSRKIDIGPLKPLLHDVQVAVKNLSQTISRSSIYNQASKNDLSTLSTPVQPLAAPSPAWSGHTGSVSQVSNGYITPVPATPLSAALGPAIQATVANGMNGIPLPREYYPAPPTTARMVHERNDTVILPGASQPKRP